MCVEWTGRPTICNGVDEATPARRLSRATLGLGVFKMAEPAAASLADDEQSPPTDQLTSCIAGSWRETMQSAATNAM